MPQTLNSTLRWSGKTDYITVNATSAPSVAFDANTFDIRVVSTTNCHINIGDGTPTAVATDNNGMYLPSGVIEYFHVNPGQKLAVVRDTADGVISVAQMTR